MKPPIILDTSALFSLLSRDDANHAQARTHSAAFGDAERAQILPADVFSELVNILGKKVGREIQLSAAQDLMDSPDILIIETDQEIRSRAIKTLETQAGSVSYTDCVVMACAEKFQTKEIFGFDRIFHQNGYDLPEAA